MNNTIKFSVDTKNSEKRLDVFLAENINHLTRSFLKKLIESKQVKLNNFVQTSPSTKIKYKDLIYVNIVQNLRSFASIRQSFDDNQGKKNSFFSRTNSDA